MRNVGPVTRRWLAEIDIHTSDDLRQVGAVETYRFLVAKGHPENMNLLYSLIGAETDKDWREIARDHEEEDPNPLP